MHTAKLASLTLLIFVLSILAAGQGFKPYPAGTKYTPPDTKENREMMKAMPPGTTSTAYITKDSYEKVVAFYKGFAKEYKMPGMPANRKLPTGQEMKQTFFIFDGAADISTSKSWAKVQNPFIGSVDFKGGAPVYSDVRDVTEIVLSEKK